MHNVTHGFFDSKYESHQVLTLTVSQISHFDDMLIPNDSAKTR
jgi:hypothetical protein